MEFDARGVKRGHRFLRATMRSAGGLSYSEAQAAIDGQPSKRAAPLLDTVLRPPVGRLQSSQRGARGPWPARA
ncbi:MAG: hypothetical protein AAF753_08590 [Pseudomonadota bacterium]